LIAHFQFQASGDRFGVSVSGLNFSIRCATFSMFLAERIVLGSTLLALVISPTH
jgi:hypothetical protein